MKQLEQLSVVMLSALVAISLPAILNAQAGVGTIVGTVFDPNGAVVLSADVQIVDHATGTIRHVAANAEGYYIVPSLQPAVYDITITAKGFATFRRTAVTLLADQNLTVNAHLAVGSASQTVSVSAESTQVDSTTGTLSQVVGQKQILDLPLDGRNAVELATLVPGATWAPADSDDQGDLKTLPVVVTLSVNGSRGNQTGYYLDGSTNNDIYTNVNQPFPFPDALQEFSVQSSDYSAVYGGNSGAVVNAISKSGTNHFHGDLFEFNRNAVFNARNYFASVRDQLKRNQFGAVIGGPIKHNKTFFFFGYQQTQVRDIANGNTAYVPTGAELNGDFSAIPTQLVNPTTGAPYPKNQIPTTSFDPAAVDWVKNYMPSSGASSGVVYYGVPESQSFDEYMASGDQNLSPKDHLFLRYYLDVYNNNPYLDPTNYLSNVSRSEIFSHNAIISETHIFSPNLLNVVRISMSRVTTNAGADPNSISVADLGVKVTQPTSFGKALDGINVSSYWSVSSFPPSIMNRTNFPLSDNLSWVRGRHSFNFGGELSRGWTVIRDAYLAGGDFTFNANTTGNSLASFMIGSIYTFQQGNGEFKDDRDWLAALYAQDDYHMSKGLTLNLGIRWAPFIPFYEIKGRVEQFRAANYYAGIVSTQFPNAPAGLLFPGDPGMPKNGVTSSCCDFSPRVGFAYDVRGNGSTAIRGGFGVFFDSQQVGIENNRFVDVSPFSTQVDLTEPVGTFSNPYLGVPNPFPAPATPSKNSTFPAPVLAATYDPSDNSREPAPVTYNYNLTVEHQFPQGILARAGYVGSLSQHEVETVELDPAVYTPGSTLSTQQRRIFPQYSSIGQGTSDVNANYNSLQLTAQRRMNNITAQANFTYSKSLDDVPAGQGDAGIASQDDSALPVTNPDRHAFDYGPSDFDHRYNFTGSYVWDLPRLKRENAALRAVAGAWQTNGIINYASGFALTALAGADRSQTGLNEDRAEEISPNVRGGNACAGVAYCRNWLNPAAFVTNYTATSYPLGTAGNTGKGAFEGPHFVAWTAGLTKNFPLHSEQRELQFQAQFFNVLNHTNLGNPSLTANSPNFGKITSYATDAPNAEPRVGQLALKLIF